MNSEYALPTHILKVNDLHGFHYYNSFIVKINFILTVLSLLSGIFVSTWKTASWPGVVK